VTGTGIREPGSPGSSHPTPPQLADRLLRRILPTGKRGESIRGDLIEEFNRLPDSGSRFAALWFWQQTLRLAFRYAASRPPQQSLTYPGRRPMWFELTNDLKMAARGFVRTPGTSLVIVLTLAIAIGVATIGFAFADLALLRGLPVDDASKVVSVFTNDAQGSNPRARLSGPDFLDYAARSTTLEKLAVMRDGRAPLIRNGQSQTLTVTFASADIFASMGQQPILGRAFLPGDDRPGAPPVVVLAHRFWRSEFDGREDVIGRTLQIGREHYTVVGVLSPAIEFGNIGEIEAWLPTRIDPQSPRDARNFRFLARLKDGVTFEQAAAETAAIGAALASEHPRTNGGWTVRLVPVSDLIGGDSFWVVIALFLLSIGLLMAIATANVSNIVMVRTLARGRELAVRTALGARKGRLVRQFLTEGLVLSAVAALLALPIAWAGLQAIQSVSAEAVFRQLTIDLHELGFVAALALVCPLMFSLAPVRLLSRPDLRHVLAAGGRGTTTSMRGRSVLVVVQVALAVILLTVSSLSLRSIRAIYTAPVGMDVSALLIFGLEFDEAQYASATEAQAAALATRDQLRKAPGVETVGVVTSLPILGDAGPLALTIDNAVADEREARPTAVVTGMTHDTGRALGLRLLAGEWWSEGSRDVAVVSEAAARRYLGGVEQAIGRFVSFAQDQQLVRARVIGVATDIADTDRTSSPPPRLFVPFDAGRRRFAYLVRAGNPGALAGEVRSVVAAQAPTIPIEYLMTFDQAMTDAASSDYVVIGMLGGFALVALVLASAGLFGIVSFTVAQRTAEFGTRMALGARAADVVRLVARQSFIMIAIGLAIGIAGGVGIGFAMQAVLQEMSPADPLTLAMVSTILAVVALAATALPAWRAARIDPVVALRAD
jgi:putative ABC transport system permease protein